MPCRVAWRETRTVLANPVRNRPQAAHHALAHPALAHPALAHPVLTHPALALPALAHPTLARLVSPRLASSPDRTLAFDRSSPSSEAAHHLEVRTREARSSDECLVGIVFPATEVVAAESHPYPT
eukprot:CAMPEP_0181224866 /NCGR_PEP_ID=MMETSP1096-20121128/31372_1 /TAXON_ID=156174 ORGANISM="Chrysochromulina ericina, Strain CCMP281" /NCGR_SAMPLE_ID=MMETSP1096 /ASSEMBLY_ACC=CAM_ASM_000453 /LENGTH=124 /DNA_ID=CAMNT_0023318011 /DNA_START=477 /DNA_END=849 /DNA_ORIENTATION=-